LKLNYDQPFSNFAFDFKPRRYTKGGSEAVDVGDASYDAGNNAEEAEAGTAAGPRPRRSAGRSRSEIIRTEGGAAASRGKPRKGKGKVQF
jgi:hypothetical protein